MTAMTEVIGTTVMTDMTSRTELDEQENHLNSEASVKVKICGLRRLCDIDYVNQYRPDYAGFVLAPSRRQVTPAKLAELTAQLSPDIPAVGVFVNAPIEEIASLAEKGLIHIAQLHGDESPDYCKEVQRQGVRRIWKALRVRTEEDIHRMTAYEAETEAILLDAFAAEAYGGTGKSFPHEWLRSVPAGMPYFLAGGIQAETVPDLINTYRPYGLDVSSSVETDGMKDSEKIKRLLKAVRGATKTVGEGK